MDVKPIQDQNRMDAMRPRSGPRYVQISLGREERWKIGSPINSTNIKDFIDPELKLRGWCPDSYDVLQNTIIDPGDLGLRFIIKCKGESANR